MKKLAQLGIILTVGLLTLVGGANLKSAHAKRVSSNRATTLKTYPQKMCGTWYHYVGHFHGKDYYNTDKFTAKKYTNTLYYQHNRKLAKYAGSSPLKFHALKYRVSLKAMMRASKSQLNWGIANSINYKGRQYINVDGWFAGAGNGDFFNVSKQKIAGKNTKMLADGTGAGTWMDAKRSFYFSSKKIAKQAAHKHFSNFDYYV